MAAATDPLSCTRGERRLELLWGKDVITANVIKDDVGCAWNIAQALKEVIVFFSFCFFLGRSFSFWRSEIRNDQDFLAEKLATFGFVPNPMTPAALASLIDSDIAAYAAMVKRTRISAD